MYQNKELARKNRDGFLEKEEAEWKERKLVSLMSPAVQCGAYATQWGLISPSRDFLASLY